MNILKYTKYKNVLKNNKVAFVIDDLKSVDPWDPGGIRIYGTADIVSRQDGYMERGIDRPNNNNPHQYIRIKPEKKWSWELKNQSLWKAGLMSKDKREEEKEEANKKLILLSGFNLPFDDNDDDDEF